MKLNEFIKESGMYKMITDDESEFIMFVTGTSPFLKIENDIWNCYGNIMQSIDHIRGCEFKQIIKLLDTNQPFETVLKIKNVEIKTLNELKELEPMINPITYELINPELWEDGLYLSPNLMDENLKINFVYEVKNHKVIKVYKNK
jgi:hypothetical protein